MEEYFSNTGENSQKTISKSYLLWEIVLTKKKKKIRLGVWKAQGLRKDGFGHYLAMKGKKGKKKLFVCKARPYHTDTNGKLGQYIKKGAIAPLIPQKGDNGPLFKELCPPFEEKRGERYKKGGNDTDRNTESPAKLILLPAKYRYRISCW